jgi:hypothetical protein
MGRLRIFLNTLIKGISFYLAGVTAYFLADKIFQLYNNQRKIMLCFVFSSIKAILDLSFEKVSRSR